MTRRRSTPVAVDWPIRRLLLLVGLLVLVGGCAGTTPTMAPSAAAVATGAATGEASPRPSVTPRPTPTPRPTATPEPTVAVSGATAIERFVAFAETSDIPYHMEVDLEVGVLSQSVRLAMSMDTVGSDMTGTIRMASGGQRYDIDVVVVDGREFASIDGGTWLEVPDAGTVENPWTTLPLDLLSVEGSRLIDEVPHHHLVIDDPAVADTTDVASETITDVVIDEGLLDLYVTDDGLPTRARISIRGSAVASGISTELEVVSVYEFSEIGTPVEIEAPF